MKTQFIVLKFKKILSIIIFCIVLFLLFAFSKNNLESIKNNTYLFIYSIFPSLFPFVFFTEFVLNTKVLYIICDKLKKVLSKVFPISIYAPFAIIIGFLCGFPSGAKAIISLYQENKINYRQAKALIIFNNNCNPIFIFTTIGICIFQNSYIGYILILAHYLSSIIIGIIVSKLYLRNIIHENCYFLNTFNEKSGVNYKKSTIFENIKNSIKKSFLTLLYIFGFILIFGLISDISFKLLQNFIDNKDYLYLLTSIFEITSGISHISNTCFALELKIIIVSILLGFSGMCIIFQIFSVIHEYGFKLKDLIISKIIHGILSGFISFIILKLIRYFNIFIKFDNVDVFSNNNSNNLIIDTNFTSYMQNIIIFYIILSILLFSIFLILILKKIVKLKFNYLKRRG